MPVNQKLIDMLRNEFPGMVNTAVDNFTGGGATRGANAVKDVTLAAFEKLARKEAAVTIREAAKGVGKKAAKSSGKDTSTNNQKLQGLLDSMQGKAAAKPAQDKIKSVAASLGKRTGSPLIKDIGTGLGVASGTGLTAAAGLGIAGAPKSYPIGEFPPASEDYKVAPTESVSPAVDLAASKGILLQDALTLLADPNYETNPKPKFGDKVKWKGKKAPLTTSAHNQNFIKTLKAVAKSFPSITDHVKDVNGRLQVVADERLNQSIYASVQDNGVVAYTNLQPDGRLLQAPTVQDAIPQPALAPAMQPDTPEAKLSNIARARQGINNVVRARSEFIANATAANLQNNENYQGILQFGIPNAKAYIDENQGDPAATKDLTAMNNELTQFRVQAKTLATREANANPDLTVMDNNAKSTLADARLKLADDRSGRGAVVNFLVNIGQSEADAEFNASTLGDLIRGLIGPIQAQNGKPLKGDVYLGDTTWHMNQLYTRFKAKDKPLADAQLQMLDNVRTSVLADMNTIEFRQGRKEALQGADTKTINADVALQYKSLFNIKVKDVLMSSLTDTSMNLATIKKDLAANKDMTVDDVIAKLTASLQLVDERLKGTDITLDYGIDKQAVVTQIGNLTTSLRNPPITFIDNLGNIGAHLVGI